MHHIFNTFIATKYGVNEAIFLNNIAFWIHQNKANNKNFHDGRYWTYNSHEAFATLFPYWTAKSVRTVINNCLKKNLLMSGNYNTKGYDRTKWYTLTDQGLALFPALNPYQPSKNLICPNGHMQLTERSHAIDRTGRPIPDVNSDNLTSSANEFAQAWELFWKAYPVKKNKSEL
jgi:hypothetical protein